MYFQTYTFFFIYLIINNSPLCSISHFFLLIFSNGSDASRKLSIVNYQLSIASCPLKRIALFPGTFDPFTIGHESLVSRGLELVDEIIISIGINDTKRTYFSLEKRLKAIQELYKDEPRVRVMSYDSLTVDFAQQMNAGFILRGIRTVNDFEYEKSIADVNRKLSGIETFILFTEPEHTHISSSIVRELLRYGKDISQFVPKGTNLY